MPVTNAARMLRVASAVALVALFSSTSAVAQYEASATYYSGITGTGATLKSQLKTLMTTNRSYTSYDDAGDYLPFTDAVPGNLRQMYLVYDRTVVTRSSVTAVGFTGNAANQYGSREHVWPDSRQTGSQPDGDIMMLKPSVSSSVSSSPNAQRGNLFYGGATNTGGATKIGTSSNQQFFAGDFDKGDVARISFYAATTYSQTLSLINGVNDTTSNNTMGDLNTMLHWHYLDTPDTFELRRNDVAYRGDDAATTGDDYTVWAGTNARNAYIDRPEYVWSVYGDQANDTKLTLAAGTVNADGSSTQTVNLGRVLKGAAVPASQSITLSKKGVDGTYYSVAAGGDATSSVTGRYNAFAMDADGTKAITVGLNTTTTTAGLKSGTVTINNLDVTTGGGAGAGANDGNDVATIQLSVLDASNSTFSATADVDALTLDFGLVKQGESADTKAFSIFDRASMLGAALTAMLDLDTINGSGSTSKFSTTLAAFSNLAAGSTGKDFAASFDTSTLGQFTATYILGLSDENLPGTVGTTSLTLTLTGTVVPVPEPMAFAVIAIGLVPMIRRRRAV